MVIRRVGGHRTEGGGAAVEGTSRDAGREAETASTGAAEVGTGGITRVSMLQ